MAIGHVDKILPLKVFIDNIINEAEQILKTWGYMGDVFNTL
jgi:hypothetical protein